MVQQYSHVHITKYSMLPTCLIIRRQFLDGMLGSDWTLLGANISCAVMQKYYLWAGFKNHFWLFLVVCILLINGWGVAEVQTSQRLKKLKVNFSDVFFWTNFYLQLQKFWLELWNYLLY